VSAVFIAPTEVTLGQGQSQVFEASGGSGSYSWGATGGDLDTTTGSSVAYTAGNQNGDFNVVVSSGGTEAVAIVHIGGLEIVALDSTQLDIGETLRFEITNPAEHQAPFSWLSTDPSVGTILPVEGGIQGELTAQNVGITKVYAQDDLGVESNRLEVIVGNTVEIPKVIGEAGKRAVAHINASNAFGESITSLQMAIQFDPSLLQARQALVTYRTAHFSLGATFDNGLGSALILLTSLTGEQISAGNGPILDLIFDVNAEAAEGATSPLAFTSVEMVPLFGAPIPVVPRDGLFEVCSTCLVHDGDVNGDGKISIIDLQLVINIYLQRYTPNSEEFAAADIAPASNGDGVVNVVDVLKVLNKILGKPTLRQVQEKAPLTQPVQLAVQNQLSAQAGESLVIPIRMANPVPVGGLDITLAYTQVASIIPTNPTVSKLRGSGLSLQTNGDNPGFLQIIMHSPDAVQAIPAGNGDVLLIDMGTIPTAVNSELVVVEAAVSDVNGTPINFEITTEIDTPTIYLPLVIK
jgi:hypothetical protein